jgi:hypothetical protein
MSNATGKLVGLRLAFITCFILALPSLGYLLSSLLILILLILDLDKPIFLLSPLWALFVPEFLVDLDLINMFCVDLRFFILSFMPIGLIFYTLAWVILRFGFVSVLPSSSKLVDVIILAVYTLGLLVLFIRAVHPSIFTFFFFNQPIYSMADFGLNSGFLELLYCSKRGPIVGSSKDLPYAGLLTLLHLIASTLLSLLLFKVYSRSGEKLFLIPAVLAIIVHIPRLPLIPYISYIGTEYGVRIEERDLIILATLHWISSLLSLFSWAFYWIPLGIAFLRLYRRIAVKPSKTA